MVGDKGIRIVEGVCAGSACLFVPQRRPKDVSLE